MNLQDLSLEQLKEIVKGAPDGAEFKFGEKYGKDWRANLDDPEIDPKQYPWRYALWCSATKSWNDSIFVGEDYSGLFLNLSDIRARITELEPVFRVGDQVVILQDTKALDERYVHFIDDVDYKLALISGEWIFLKNLRHATAEEIAAGHRIDEPSSSCGMTAAEIDQFGEDLRKKPYVDFPEFEQPDTITTQLDPAKCRVVDPALAYDSPGDCPKDDFDAMSEKHRSPSCKCHEFPFDAELKPDPFQQAKNKQQEEISQGKCGEFMAGYDRGFLTAWNERQDEIDSCEKIAQAVVQLEMQKNRQLQERINDLERRNRAFHEKNVDLERSCKMQHAEWSHMKQLLDKALKGEQGE